MMMAVTARTKNTAMPVCLQTVSINKSASIKISRGPSFFGYRPKGLHAPPVFR